MIFNSAFIKTVVPPLALTVAALQALSVYLAGLK